MRRSWIKQLFHPPPNWSSRGTVLGGPYMPDVRFCDFAGRMRKWIHEICCSYEHGSLYKSLHAAMDP